MEVFAEIGEILSGKKTLPKVPECGKKFITFKNLGEVWDLSNIHCQIDWAHVSGYTHVSIYSRGAV